LELRDDIFALARKKFNTHLTKQVLCAIMSIEIMEYIKIKFEKLIKSNINQMFMKSRQRTEERRY